jgi:transposase-like protein
MDVKTQIIAEYLTQGSGFRKLAAKYGISRTHLQMGSHSPGNS